MNMKCTALLFNRYFQLFGICCVYVQLCGYESEHLWCELSNLYLFHSVHDVSAYEVAHVELRMCHLCLSILAFTGFAGLGKLKGAVKD